MTDERTQQIAYAAGREPAVVRWMYEGDWEDGTATQEWMATGDLQEVAEWVASCTNAGEFEDAVERGLVAWIA